MLRIAVSRVYDPVNGILTSSETAGGGMPPSKGLTVEVESVRK